MAMTADGKIATANRAISSFTSRRDREHLLELRATADAVMAAARTVDLNPVTMGPGARKYRVRRKQAGLAEYNLRVVVSRRGTVSRNAEIFRRKFSPIIILTTRCAGRRLKLLNAVADEVRVCGSREIDFRQALGWLRRKWNVNRILCEGGGALNDALFRAGLVDELHLTVSPRIFGGSRAPTIADGAGAKGLEHATEFELKSARRVGNEMFLVYVRKSAGLRPAAPATRAGRRAG